MEKLINIIILILSSVGFSYWMTQNSIIRNVFNKLKINKLLCSQCIAFFMFIILLLTKNLILIFIGMAGLCSFIANEMEKKTNN